MADIYSTVQVLIRVLTPLITAEHSLISGLRDDVKAIKTELQEILGFLKDAEERAEGDNGIKEWVRRVRIFAYDIQDAIERFQLYKKETVFGKIRQVLTLELRGTASTIKDLRQRAPDIGRQRFSSGSNSNNVNQQGSANSIHTQTTSYHLIINSNTELVGTETPKQEIIKLLGLQEARLRFSTTVVVGMRGLGKTTLAGSIFNDSEVKSSFPIRAWITVTNPRNYDNILRSMMQQFCETAREHKIHNWYNNEMSEKNIINRMDSMGKTSFLTLAQKYLKKKRYLIVFDDVQARNMDFASYINRLVPTNDKGSKILVTTRHENVAHTWLDGPFNGLYKLKPLTGEQAWDLFCKKAFNSGGCPTSLHDLAQEIVRKCGGLPPAILAIGGLLSRKTNDVQEWRKVHSSLGFYLQRDHQLSGIYKALMQNYHDLPYYLKPCFLYFGLFHKGCPIDRMRLIRLWIAEGFIGVSRGDITLEEVAEEYMNELINMSLVEVRSTDTTGRPSTLGIANEFLHEIILVKLDELSFCQIHSKKETVGSEMTRRLSIHKNHYIDAHQVSETISKSKNIRSLLLIDAAQDLIPKVLSREFFNNVRLLKVLDLYNAPIGGIPDALGKLLNLHYLSLRNTRVELLPSSLGKLQSLQTLDLKQTLIHKLPNEINQLHRLRHLLNYSYKYDFSVCALSFQIKGMKIPAGALGKCLELQKLAFLDVGGGNKNLMMQLKNLKQLRKLGIVGLKSEHGKDLCSVVEEMKHLQTFSVFSTTPRQTLDVQNMRSPPRVLKRLSLNGHLMSFPGWILELPSIAKIYLRWSNLHDDPLGKLQLLPNLVELLLLEAYSGEHLRIQNAGFQKLKFLHLLDLDGLMSLSISKGALPSLEELSMGESKKLQIPSDVKYLTNLKTLSFYNMPPSFSDCLQPGKQNYPILKHVPNVGFYSKHPQGYWQRSNFT